MSDLNVIYILGRGRSGSTFVENALSSELDVTLLGEARLWPDCYRDDHMCSCGAPKTTCSYWQPVIETLPDRDAAKAAFNKTIARKGLLALFVPRFLADRLLPGVRSHVSAFYRHIAATHGAKCVIDSSKNPAYGLLMAQSEGLDVTLVHVIRHPMGVAYSWKRQRQKASEAALYKVRKSLVRGSFEWLASNLLAEIAKLRSGSPRHTIRYEDLGNADTLPGLVSALDHLKAEDGKPGETHAMSGNPGAASRSTDFKLDEEWRSGLGWHEKLICGLITYPLFIFYRRAR